MILTSCRSGDITNDIINDSDESVIIEDNLVRVESKPSEGFHWDYYLFIPDSYDENNTSTYNKHLIVEPSDNENGKRRAENHRVSNRLGVPVMLPMFDRPANIEDAWKYFILRLDRNTLMIEKEKFQRLDKQLIAMIDNAVNLLGQNNFDFNDDVYMYGLSSQAQFANRFTLLHPDRVKASVSGMITEIALPESQRSGYNLYYPLGTYDMYELTGIQFDLEKFKSTDQYLFYGEKDSDDPIYYDNVIDPRERNIYENVFNTKAIPPDETNDPESAKIIAKRLFTAQNFYAERGIDLKVKIYEGVDHFMTSEMKDDVVEFFRETVNK